MEKTRILKVLIKSFWTSSHASGRMSGHCLIVATSGDQSWRVSEMINWDVDFSDRTARYIVMVDLGDQTLTLTRDQLAEMLNALDDAEESA